jgi:hypothetical protein
MLLHSVSAVQWEERSLYVFLQCTERNTAAVCVSAVQWKEHSPSVCFCSGVKGTEPLYVFLQCSERNTVPVCVSAVQWKEHSPSVFLQCSERNTAPLCVSAVQRKEHRLCVSAIQWKERSPSVCFCNAVEGTHSLRCVSAVQWKEHSPSVVFLQCSERHTVPLLCFCSAVKGTQSLCAAVPLITHTEMECHAAYRGNTLCRLLVPRSFASCQRSISLCLWTVTQIRSVSSLSVSCLRPSNTPLRAWSKRLPLLGL